MIHQDRATWNTEMITEIFTARVVTLDIIWIFNSLVIIEQFVTNFYNLDIICVNFYFISLSIYICIQYLSIKITKSHVVVYSKYRLFVV